MCGPKIVNYTHGGRGPELCHRSRFGQPCGIIVEEERPSRLTVPRPAAPPAPIHVPAGFPPSPPRYSPRTSSRDSAARTAAATAGSDGSRHSSTSSARRRPADSSGMGIYYKNQRVNKIEGTYDRERTLFVAHPPTPRTPPQQYNIPRTAPSSPLANLSVPHGAGSPPRERYNRPYMVDERPRPAPVHLAPAAHYVPAHHLPASPASSRHSRQASTSSQGSHRSSSAALDDEERRRLRQERREREKREEHERRRADRERRDIDKRVAKANANIVNRSAVPVAAAAAQEQQQPERRSRRDGYDEVVEGMSRLRMEEKDWKERRAHERAVALEMQEAQDRRQQRERVVPSRRASVGPGSRRQRVGYDDGLYRWE